MTPLHPLLTPSLAWRGSWKNRPASQSVQSCTQAFCKGLCVQESCASGSVWDTGSPQRAQRSKGCCPGRSAETEQASQEGAAVKSCCRATEGFLMSSRKELTAEARELKGELYCLPCHDKMGVPICGACRRPIEGRVVNALGKQWHVEVSKASPCPEKWIQLQCECSGWGVEQTPILSSTDWGRFSADTFLGFVCPYPGKGHSVHGSLGTEHRLWLQDFTFQSIRKPTEGPE